MCFSHADRRFKTCTPSTSESRAFRTIAGHLSQFSAYFLAESVLHALHSMLMAGLHPGQVVRIRGQRWTLDRHVVYDTTTLLHVTGCDAENAAERGCFLLPFETVERLPVARTLKWVTPARWRHTARAVLASACASPCSLRSPVRHEFRLMPFQLEPALAVLGGLATRVLIADAVGLGKTLQAGLVIAELLEREPDPHVVVVCPSGLRDQWAHELQRHFEITAATLDATSLSRDAGSGRADNPWVAHPVVITSIDFVKQPDVIRSLEGTLWDVAIFDEAHLLSGRSDRSAAASAIAERARTVVMLTATPHSGDEAAFERLCGLGDLHSRFPLLLFRRTRDDAGVSGERRTTWLRVRPTDAEQAMHAALGAYATEVWRTNLSSGARLAMAVLTRRASSSAAALAHSLERRLTCLAHDADAISAGCGRDQGVQPSLPFLEQDEDDDARDVVLAVPGFTHVERERRELLKVLALARLAAMRESKVAALRRLLRRAAQPSIVFTEYRDTLEHLARLFARARPILLHGGLTARERAEALRQFTAGPTRLLLATDAASEGLNLHHGCRLLINLELPWTPTRLEQRAGRIDRIGQTHRAHVIHLVAAGTNEELVVTRLYRRMATVDAALGNTTPVVSQSDVATAVLGCDGEAPSAPTDISARASGVMSAVRQLARDEALRIALARQLHRRARGHRAEGRPVMTILRRRCDRGRCPQGSARRYWVFRVSCVDGGGRPFWSTLVPVASGSARAQPRGSDSARRLLTPGEAVVMAATEDEARVLTAISRAVRPGIALALQREHAIAEHIGITQARLASRVAQPGLFGRMTGGVEEQVTTTAQALSLTRRRLRDLQRCRTLTIGGRDLVFAIALD